MLRRPNRSGLFCTLPALCFTLLTLCLPTDAAWAGGNGCGQRIAGPATLTAAFFTDEQGDRSRAERPIVSGQGVLLADGRQLDDLEAPLDELIHSGVLVNNGDRPVALLFSNGEMARLEPGEALSIGDARCECRCTCKTVTGLTKVFTFPCSSNSDDCDYTGDICQWSADGVTHTGTYSGCIKVWVATDAEASPL